MNSTIAGMGAASAAWSTQAMSGASMRMPPAQKMSNLFSQIDTNNSGSISKAQFSQAFSQMNPPAGFKAMGADAIFAKLDSNGTGLVSKQDFVNGMKQMMSEVRQHAHRAQQESGSSASQTINASQSGLNQLVGASISIKA